jgi:hypothetical protein
VEGRKILVDVPVYGIDSAEEISEEEGANFL